MLQYIKNKNQYSKIPIYNHDWLSSPIPSSSKLAALMVKQNKAKVSKSKWVFLLNVIASGMGVDSYWSASSSAITAGTAIRQVRWFLGKQAFSHPSVRGKRLGKKNQNISVHSVLLSGQLSAHRWQKHNVKNTAVTDVFPGASPSLGHTYRSKLWPGTLGKGAQCWLLTD